MLLKLKESYVQVRRSGNGDITYGGDQGFFATAEEGSLDARKNKNGCGATALGDTLLYLAGKDNRFIIDETINYVKRVMGEDEYKKYYNSICDFLGGIPAKTGLSCIRLMTRFNRIARREKWSLRARWGLSGRKLYSRIEEMLEKDIPVILCIPMMLLPKDKKDALPLYIKREREQQVSFQKAAATSGHYVTITGIEKNVDKRQTFLEISSWGKKYYIYWDEYQNFIATHFLGTILGNILYIK